MYAFTVREIYIVEVSREFPLKVATYTNINLRTDGGPAMQYNCRFGFMR